MTETINYNGIEFEVEFDYSPAEDCVMYYSDMSGYPGAPAEVEIISIKHANEDFFDFLDEIVPCWIDKVEELILDKIE